MEDSLYIHTFGCQMNEEDSQRIVGLLSTKGWNETAYPEKARLIILNTCSIREKAEDKLYSRLGRLRRIKKDNHKVILAVGGCVAQQRGAELLKHFPYLDIIFGPQAIAELPHFIDRVEEGRGPVVATPLGRGQQRFSPPLAPPSGPRALVTIMEGCNNHCTFCIVPSLRGKEISRPAYEIIEEIKRLVLQGVREITLLGQNVNSYQAEMDFVDLLGDINAIEGIERVRFTTSHPRDFSERLIGAFLSLKKLCEHIHLPVQAGSNKILKRMGRGYSRETYLDQIERLRRVKPAMSVTTDIIVGFPGEEEEDFRQSVELLKTIQYDNIFSFKYSPRPGTAAKRFAHQVPEEIKSRRLRELQALQNGITLRKNQQLVGTIQEVLVEGRSKKDSGIFCGRTRTNRVVNFPGGEELIGEIVEVEILTGYPNSLRGRIA